MGEVECYYCDVTQQLKKYTTIAGAGELADVVEGTVRAAIKRKELKLHTTSCGRTQLLLVEDVKRWAKQPRKRGPKP